MPDFETAGSVSLAIAAVALVLASAAGLGGFLVRPGFIQYQNGFDAFLVRVTVGLQLLGFIGVVVGQTGALAAGRSVWLLAIFCLIEVWSEFRYQLVRTKSVGNNPAKSFLRQRAHLLGMILVGAMTLGPALCYPTGWDELVYHSLLPQRWLQDGWPALYFDLPYSGFPSFGEILFWLMAPIEQVIAPRLLIWVCWTLGLIGLYRSLYPWTGASLSATLVVAFALNDSMLLISANCYVESILLLDVVVLLLAVRLRGWPQTRRLPYVHAAILGILAGGTAAVKLTGAAVIVVPFLWYAGQLLKSESRRMAVIGPMLSYGLIAGLTCLPFYIRPWMATGNPFYPYLCEWFSRDSAQLEMSRFHQQLGGFEFGVRSLAAFVDAPLLLAFRSENYDGEFGWQLMVFVLLAIVAVVAARRRRWRPIVLWPIAVTTWFYIFWFITAQQARFAVSAVVGVLHVAGVGVRLIPGEWRRPIVLILAVATLVSIPWRRSDYYLASWLAVTGRLSRADYVHNLTDGVYMPLIQAVQALTETDAKLLMLVEHRGFYLPRRYVIATPLFQERPFTPPEQFATADSVLKVLHQAQITHVLVAKMNPGPDQAPGWIERQQPLLRAIEQCVRQQRLVLRWESEMYVLLEVAK